MKILVISDIHANLVALEAVLADAAGKYEAVWCLGDLVGYGPNPNECVAQVRALPGLVCMLGNHDVAALGRIDLSTFNVDAQKAISWTQRSLTDETVQYLSRLPERELRPPFTLVHASPRDPVWEYILDRFVAVQNFPFFETPYCLVGHTHTPVIYQLTETHLIELHPERGATDPLPLELGRFIINPGSVGQPRDNIPDAAYALLDLEALTWQFCRVPYDVAETQRRMREAGMSSRLVARLEHGW